MNKPTETKALNVVVVIGVMIIVMMDYLSVFVMKNRNHQTIADLDVMPLDYFEETARVS